ncbi:MULTISPECIES: dual OB domain-containing protein [Serratia]|uniref:dual OB domain-containing protein n=1 Tax=Serratia TaxID=613 RepID=UPI001020D201|nr:hypothetical protein [Serratia proteamaculans]RYM52562.1 hypothetical protein BSQ97_06030 [Serratia proteamaculans]
MVDKTFVCLSKSLKNKDYCIAGKIIAEDGTIGEWIRPINKFGSINDEDCGYQDGTTATTLHIISATFLKPNPQRFQTENHTIDSRYHWEYVNDYDRESLDELCDTPETLWFNNNQSGGGKNDQVSPVEARELNHSLYFIHVGKLTIHTSKWDDNFKVRGEFTYNEICYNLKVTDIYWREYYQKKDLGSYVHPNAYVTVSLALDVFNGFHYKIIADIL